ncbi:N-acetylglucosaminyl-phosphatidylinositol de-N-acetylase isoform X3 [Neoarius graeffei]|uniref:N-acetylglucosaminyl-phosphatidylinositol de-N-acetylase isoform X3 n=1 Tax=Neoarius graeffei TaxID=443677 RepID=UPI00298C1621|nr:N-acetylglucosaminyl-phosphatidylinositol de-N-acetylase isoform X3 [Neoarius graeffei]
MMDLGGAFGLGFCASARCALWTWSSVPSGSCSSVFSIWSTYLLVEFPSVSSGTPKMRILFLLDLPSRELQDDPKIEWSIALTASLILKHITTYSINLVCRPNEITWDYLSQVLTFDEGGVSGHANHIAIYKALGHLAFVGRIPEGCQVLSLHTISILRKYLSLFELPISWLLPSSFCCIIGPNEYKKAKEAMLHHRSQLLWFRRLYILFSRYMYINTFRAMPVEKKDVKFY